MDKWNNFLRMNEIHQQLANVTRIQNELEMPLVVKGMLDQIKTAKDIVRAVSPFSHENLNIMNSQMMIYDSLVSSGAVGMMANAVNKIDYKSIMPMFDDVAVNSMFDVFKSSYNLNEILSSLHHIDEKYLHLQYEFIDEIKVFFENIQHETVLQKESFWELLRRKVEGFVAEKSEKYSGEELKIKKIVASIFICLFVVIAKISADVANNVVSSFAYAVFEEVYPQSKRKAVKFVRDMFKLVDDSESRYIVQYQTPIHMRGDGNSRKIGKVIPGQIVMRVEKQGKWAMIEYEGHDGNMGGWVLNKYLLPIKRKHSFHR